MKLLEHRLSGVVGVITVCCMWVGSALAQQQSWWMEPQRMLQTNLREIDADMDLDRYIRDVTQWRANVVLFNVGGIVANYPTDLEFHWRNPNMKGDLVGTVVKRLHGKGIRVIGRFDFSKLNENLAAKRPDWLYVSEKAKQVNYNGQVHTCPSGDYQQKYMFKVLGEALERYPLDGVFFNMIGFRTRDYSGVYHGLCQCASCKRRFKEFCGLELPSRAGGKSPAWPKYQQFTRNISADLFTRVRAFVKKKRPGVAICTYTSTGVDVIRTESNRALGSGFYSDTEKAQTRMPTNGRQQLANAAVHFIHYPHRHAAVAPGLNVRRLWQLMVNGAWLDFYCIGPLQRQEDRSGLEEVGDVFRFHADNEKYLARTQSAAEVALVKHGSRSEYQGLFEILSENHVPFKLIRPDSSKLSTYRLVIVPDAGALNAGQCAALDAYVQRGGRLLLTGKAPSGLKCFSRVKLIKTRPEEKGSYIRIRREDKVRLSRPELMKTDLVFLDGRFHIYQPPTGSDGLLRLIPADMFGPPEKCYYRKVSDHPALVHATHGKGSVACFALDIGSHYQGQYHQSHAALVMGAVDGLLKTARRLHVTTTPLVEVAHRKGETFEWVSLFNHSGQRGKALHRPVPIRRIRLSLRSTKPVKTVRLLKSGKELPFEVAGDGNTLVTVPVLDQYDIVLFDYADKSEANQTSRKKTGR